MATTVLPRHRKQNVSGQGLINQAALTPAGRGWQEKADDMDAFDSMVTIDTRLHSDARINPTWSIHLPSLRQSALLQSGTPVRRITL
jgi:hypothetical protein